MGEPLSSGAVATRSRRSCWRSQTCRTQHAAVNDWLLTRANPRPGDTVLDIAAGPGGLSHAASRLVVPSGRVICTDFAPEMVEAARTLGAAQDIDNIDYRTRDHVRELTAGAGFGVIEMEAIQFERRFDENGAWDDIVDRNARLAAVIAAMDSEEREVIRAAVLDGLAPYRRAAGDYYLPAEHLAVLVRKPD